MSITKISHPLLLHEPSLFHVLDLGRKTPTILVYGPAGSSKTTQFSSRINCCTVPCPWYPLDKGAGDLSTIFYYLIHLYRHEKDNYRDVVATVEKVGEQGSFHHVRRRTLGLVEQQGV